VFSFMKYKKVLERIIARSGLRITIPESDVQELYATSYIDPEAISCRDELTVGGGPMEVNDADGTHGAVSASCATPCTELMCDCGCGLVFRDGGSAADRKPAAD